jgi:hypothetical protein
MAMVPTLERYSEASLAKRVFANAIKVITATLTN